MATTLGGVTLPDPFAYEEGHQITVSDTGGHNVTSDGKISVFSEGSRKRFSLRWVGMTGTQRETLWRRYWNGLLVSQAYSPPESTDTYTVLAVRDSWTETTIKEAGITFRYNIAFALYEENVTSAEMGVMPSEAVSVAEAVTIWLMSPNVSEAVSVSEAVTIWLMSPAVSESIAVTESVSVWLMSPKVSDGVAVAESVTAAVV